MGREVAYIWSKNLQDAADKLPSNVGRSSIVHDLVRSLDLLCDNDPTRSQRSPSAADDDTVRQAAVVAPDLTLGTAEQLKRYHTPAYVDYLLSDHSGDSAADVENGTSTGSASSLESDSDSDNSSNPDHRPRKRLKTERHGFEHDCPPFPVLRSYALQIASGTLTACRLLASGRADIAIHWDGGRHHALRSRASGFCYVADIVLGIMLLSKESIPRMEEGTVGLDGADVTQAHPTKVKSRRPRIMYIDFDLHYGDGVASAFHSPTAYPAVSDTAQSRPLRPPQVLTLSIHHSAPAFFPPPTPLSLLPAADTFSPFTLSIPLRAYPSRRTYHAIWPSVERVYQAYKPDYAVLQLGADGLPGDPIGQWGNWASHGPGGMIWVAEKVKSWGIPLCILGGGGYRNADTARAWAGVTAAMVNRQVAEDADVPHHDHFPDYAPSFTMGVSEGQAKDENTSEYIAEIDCRYQAFSDRIGRLVKAQT